MLCLHASTGVAVKRVTILFDDEALYRAVKAEAAKDGKPVKDAVAEALQAWLSSRSRISPEQAQRRLAALRSLDEIRSRQTVQTNVVELLEELRAERS